MSKFKAGQIVIAKGSTTGSKYRVVGYKSVGYKSLVLEGVLTNAIFDVVEDHFVEFAPKFEVGKTYTPHSGFSGHGIDGPLFVAAIFEGIVYTISPPPGSAGSMGSSYRVWSSTQDWASKYIEVTD